MTELKYSTTASKGRSLMTKSLCTNYIGHHAHFDSYQCCNESPTGRVTSRVESLKGRVTSRVISVFDRVESVASLESSQRLHLSQVEPLI